MSIPARLFAIAAAGRLLCGVAAAEELREPPVASGLGVADIDERGCGLSNPASVVRARLIVRDTLRRIGPYVIKLPGYSSLPDMLPPDSVEPWGPFQIKAKPGDTLRIDLVNQLQDGETIPQSGFQNNANGDTNDRAVNLHTHGLIVKPRPFSPCGALGDYIFDAVDWKNTASYRIDIPERVAGGYLHTPKNDRAHDGKGPYPTGPYWIHSHLHGQAKPSVLAGQSAFLSLDCLKPDDADACPNSPSSLHVQPDDVKILALRDLQAWVDANHTPDKITTDLTSATQNAFFVTDLYDTKACEPNAAQPGKGFCQGAALVANPDGTFRQGVMGDVGVLDPAVLDKSGNPTPSQAPATVEWLYTVNGQSFPNITVKPDKPQLWRIANMSAVVTYRLRLVHHAASGGSNVPFEIVTVDGALAGTATGAGDFKLKRSASELVLMPSARAEILVDWQSGEAGDAWTLETQRFCTGVSDGPVDPTDRNNGGCSADPYPAIALASVTMTPQPAATPMGRMTLQAAAPAQAVTFQRRSVKPARTAAPVPANCIGLPKSGYRTIRFEQDAANFFIGPLDADAAEDDARLAEVHSFRHEIPPNMRKHVCVEGGPGRAELWVLQNDTDELHNFHIHQSKFRLATPDELKMAGLVDVVHDPNGLLAERAPEMAAALAAEAKNEGAVWHDSVPVPPRKVTSDGAVDFGRTAIVIPFMDDIQIGTFVYHCHILEHEDGGMMGVVEVYNPAKPRAAEFGSNVRRAGFCGPPPAGYTPIPARAQPAPGWSERLSGLLGL